MDIDTPPLNPPPVDCLLLVSFGGPEGPDDVAAVPRPTSPAVAASRRSGSRRSSRHYLDVFGGCRPINEQCRALVAALEAAQDRPVYWGNRNWHPFLADALQQMADDGRRHDAYAIVTSAFPSYSGCRQYREDIARAQVDGLPSVVKLRHYYCEEGFLAPMRRNVVAALGGLMSRGWSSPRTRSRS